MDRRAFLMTSGALALAPATGVFAQAGSLRAAAREAWIYSLPLIEIATTRARGIGGPRFAGMNRFAHNRQLSTDQSRAVTAPNNDTLYSTAWLDLSRGPVELTIPPTGDRYISAAVMNAYSDNDVILGTRTTGNGGGRYTLVGPGFPGLGPDIVRISTPQAWLLVRTLAGGPEDLPAVVAVQDALRLTGPDAPLPPPGAGRNAPWAEYFAHAQALIVANPPPATDGAVFARMAPLGLGPRGGFNPGRFAPAQAAEIEAGIADARAGMQNLGLGASVQGWNYPRANLGFFGQDYAFRAAVALAGLAALTPAEAMYMQPAADQGRMFTGKGPYRLSFSKDQLPAVDGFWSLTMYEATPEGQFFLVPNAQNRFSIGDRTPGLKYNADGSLDIWISRADPGPARRSNWLPAPATGPFSLSFRAYLPRPDFMMGRYRLPAIAPA